MYPNLVSLLCLLNIGIGSSLNRDWMFLEGKDYKDFLSKANQEVQKGALVPVTRDGGKWVAVLTLSPFGFVTIPFTRKEEVKMKKLLSISGSSKFDIVEKVHQRFVSLLDAQYYAEYFLSLQGNVRSFLDRKHEIMDGALNFLEWIEFPITGENPNLHTKRYGVIFSTVASKTFNTLFGFVLCVEINNRLVIIGYSQYAIDQSTAERGLYEYWINKFCFGHIVQLVMLFSGREPKAMAYVASLLSEIKPAVTQPFVEARVPRNAANLNLVLDLLYAWESPKRTLAIFQLTVTYEPESGQVHQIVLYFFGSFDCNGMKLGHGFYFGPFETKPCSAILTLLDFSNPTHTTGHIASFNPPGDTIAGMIICVVDFVARRCAQVGRDDFEKTPFFNHLIEGATRAMDDFGITDFNTIAALLLSGAVLRGWVGLAEVREHFGKSIFDLLRFPRPDLEQLTREYVPKPVSFEFDLNRELQMHGRQDSVYLLIKRRMAMKRAVRKAYLIQVSGEQSAQPLKPEAEPLLEIIIVHCGTYDVAGVMIGLYNVFEEQPNQVLGGLEVKVEAKHVYQFLIESSPSGYFVGELSQPQKSTLPLRVRDYLLALQFSGVIDHSVGGKGKAQSVHGKEMSSMIHILVLVARKTCARSLRANDPYGTPHINKAIAIVRILIMEGNLRNLNVMLSAIGHGLLVYTEITYDQLCQLLGYEVASTIRRLAENNETKDNVSETEAVECMKVILIKMAIMIYEMRQLTQQSQFLGLTLKAKIIANSISLNNWSESPCNTIFANGKGKDLVKVYTELHQPLQKLLNDGLVQLSPPREV